MVVGVGNGDGERGTEAHAIFHAFRAVIVHANCSFVLVREKTNRNGVTFLCNVTPLFESADASGAASSGPACGSVFARASLSRRVKPLPQPDGRQRPCSCRQLCPTRSRRPRRESSKG